MSLRKALSLMRQAEADLEAGCYDKAVSSAYFACRMAAEQVLIELRAPIPRRDDKLANSVGNVLGRRVAEELKLLYSWRIQADYYDTEVDRGSAVRILDRARALFSRLEEWLREHAERATGGQ